jgi:transcriptional regulator with XRE-family HTH domain
MNIYEKIFARMEELHMSQTELSRRTGIATSTISDWRKKQINPQADKLVAICKALEMSLVDLLCDEEEDAQQVAVDYLFDDKYVLELAEASEFSDRKNLSIYFKLLEICKEINKDEALEKNKRNVSVIQDVDGNNIVVINDIRFKGKRSVNWKEVREYLKEYVGDFYTIAAIGDVIYIGSDLPKEYTGSQYTNSMRGTNAKAKANATTGIPELIEIAVGKHFRTNKEDKHKRDGKNGWYRYDSRFALPVYGDDGEVERYNVFHASMLIRHSNDEKMYLYDIIDIKKETSNSLGE